MAGASLSILIVTGTISLELPARSVQAPFRTVPAPEVLSVSVADAHTTLPLCTKPWSPPVKVTVTGTVRFQPAAFGAGDTSGAEIVGGVLSILIVTDFVVVTPTLFVAEQVRVWPVVSAVSSVEPQPVVDAMPLIASATIHSTVTSLRYQPSPPATPVIFGVTVGALPHAFVNTAT